MKKTKAIFAALMITVVASVSGVCWFLSEQGYFGGEAVTEPDNSYVRENYGENEEVNEQTTASEAETEEEITVVSKNEINEFLSVFAACYFSENSAYTPEKRSNYELLRFAYSYISKNEPSEVEYIKNEGDTMGYNCVSEEKVNEILEKYLDVSVPSESVYTENDYAFFKYEGGSFKLPAAGGLPYKNTAKAGTVEQNGDNISVRFEIFTGDELYATGEAGIKIYDGRLVLTYYSVNKQ